MVRRLSRIRQALRRFKDGPARRLKESRLLRFEESPILNLFRRPRRERRGERGVALVMAISSLALITYLAMEVMYDANVEYTVNSQALNRLKAYYAAKSGLDLSLLRIKIYQGVMQKVGNKPEAEPFKQYIDEIWRFPFAWPLPMPEEAMSVDKEAVGDIVKKSLIDASFVADIQDEGSKTDLADLVSPSKTLRELTHKRLVDLFKRKVEEDDDWRNRYGSVNFDEFINNIADWMSDKNSSLNGGDKKSKYADLNRGTRDAFPPNRGFRTVQEMRLVAGMNDDFFDLLTPQITIYGMRGVNPNVASKELLKSLDKGIDDRVADEIIKRRSDPTQGPFTSADSFWSWLQNPPAAARLDNQDYKDIPLYFDSLISFRIKSTGEFAGAVREITVIVTDLDRTASRLKKYIDDDVKKAGGAGAGAGAATGGASGGPAGTAGPAGAGPGAGNSTSGQNNPLPKGPPRIVYWMER